MTVSSSTSRVSYNGNGSTTVFAYTFKVFDQDDLTVIIRSANGTETVKTITTHYTVSGVGSAGGGNVTMLTAPASGESIVILREQDLVQEFDLVPNDPFPAQLMEDALDKLTFMVQQHSEELDRAIKAHQHDRLHRIYHLGGQPRQQDLRIRQRRRTGGHAGDRHLSRQLGHQHRLCAARPGEGHQQRQHLHLLDGAHLHRISADQQQR